MIDIHEAIYIPENYLGGGFFPISDTDIYTRAEGGNTGPGCRRGSTHLPRSDQRVQASTSTCTSQRDLLMTASAAKDFQLRVKLFF